MNNDTLTSVELEKNEKPVLLKQGKTTKTSKRPDGFNVFTVKPSNDLSVDFSVNSSTFSEDTNLSEGGSVPYPFIFDSEGNFVEIENISDEEKHNFKTGWYGITGNTDHELTRSFNKVKPFQTIKGKSESKKQTLTIKSQTTVNTLALVFIGNEKPYPVFLNTEKDDLPEQWQDLENSANAKFTNNEYKADKKNYHNKTIFIVNASSDNHANFEVKLQ
ncbi:hypothetical protein [Tenacibaculum ovolyticum]|uniref:hypothetical protein n=1 Tax=Tenacibaculum ovolyticum TaxID=104270 RepID=UPI0007ECCE9B|nr:hypothetical protein [Tenacibaculum ovolyticum]